MKLRKALTVLGSVSVLSAVGATMTSVGPASATTTVENDAEKQHKMRPKLLRRCAGVALALAGAAILTGVAGSTTSAVAAPATWQVGYSAHIQNYGWQPEQYDGGLAGDAQVGDNAMRMEALTVHLNPAVLPGASVCYQAQIQYIGWNQSEKCNGDVAGTTGLALRMEALTISLSNAPAWGICYQAQIENTGWQAPSCDGQVAGTVGQSLEMKNLRIWLYHRTIPVALRSTIGPQINQGAWHLQTSATLYENRDAVTGADLSAYLQATTRAWVDWYDPFGFHGSTWLSLGPVYYETPLQPTGSSGASSSTISWSAPVPLSIANQDANGAIYTHSSF
jgi:Clostridial hydrophobic W